MMKPPLIIHMEVETSSTIISLETISDIEITPTEV